MPGVVVRIRHCFTIVCVPLGTRRVILLRDPPVNVHDPNFHAGATVSLRTPAAGDNGVTLFARTGVLVPIDASSSAATPNVNGPVATTGTANLRENIAVPLYGGVTIPAKNVGVPIQNLSFEAFGGADIKSEKFGFNLTEATGGVAAASQTYWTANPAAGAGIQYYLGTFYGVPTSFGAAYIVDFQLSNHSVTAPSPSTRGALLHAHQHQPCQRNGRFHSELRPAAEIGCFARSEIESV